MTEQEIATLSDQVHAARLAMVDRAVTLSSGALALSIAFRKDLVGMVPVDLWALKLAWVCFGIATVTGSFMHLARVSAILRIRWQDDDVWATKAHPLFAGNYRLCLTAFAAGMAALAWFGFHNVN